MAALARSLNVAPSALYNHMESKRDVLLLVEDHLTALFDAPAFGSRTVGGSGPKMGLELQGRLLPPTLR